MRTLLSLLALTLFIPASAEAYLTPEQVLEEDDYVEAPPNSRNAEARRATQEAIYDARAAAAAEAAMEAANTTADEGDVMTGTLDDLHGAADGETVEAIDWHPSGSDLTPEERRGERVLERVERARPQGQAYAGDDIILHAAASEPLHGGAPLAPTGAGTIVTMLAAAAAVGLTLRMALRGILR